MRECLLWDELAHNKEKGEERKDDCVEEETKEHGAHVVNAVVAAIAHGVEVLVVGGSL